MNNKKFTLPILDIYNDVPRFRNNGTNDKLYEILSKQIKKMDEELKEFKKAIEYKQNYEVLYESLDLLQSVLSINDLLYANCEVFDYIINEHKTKLKLKDWKYKGNYEININYGE